METYGTDTEADLFKEMVAQLELEEAEKGGEFADVYNNYQEALGLEQSAPVDKANKKKAEDKANKARAKTAAMNTATNTTDEITEIMSTDRNRYESIYNAFINYMEAKGLEQNADLLSSKSPELHDPYVLGHDQDFQEWYNLHYKDSTNSLINSFMGNYRGNMANPNSMWMTSDSVRYEPTI